MKTIPSYFAPLLLTLLFATANAANIVAILEITPGSDSTNLSISEYRHLTDELRIRAREVLPPDYSILTRDNILQLLPSDEKEAECLAESCAVDIGRAIGAEYVTQGSVGIFGGMLTLSVELYESMSGNMLGGFVTESDNVHGLLGTIREKSSALFTKIAEKNKVGNGSLSKSIPTNIPSEKKSNTSMWVAIGLDVLGATAIGLGIYNNAKVGDYNNEKDNLKRDVRSADYDDKKSEYESKHEKMENAATARNVFYIAGGALLAGGVAVHIWF